ncbi:hypothetical protein PHYSODRAFT_295502 [Phytophthora sojae]|uniref:Uncharacterized protein n=1 Tax=Phytophthora sojae (strain P6497) TaxID=1094619 RepID=G4YRC7_PHYSP|nr:hypothetical protein PHYSODRAFT_295502 [Phytophthora sojae]EGZ22861.1 hypothetical protein PHYSODRAFT_295502 [Phytophthora sojae]|eukprot:XP_009518149.1 hypothetical protein PHYSODRAFT_295502 [Phytophthora sojae]
MLLKGFLSGWVWGLLLGQRSDIILAANNAAANDHVGVVKQLLLHAEPPRLANASAVVQTNRHPGNVCITTAIQRVAGRGDIESLRLLLREPCSLDYLGRGLRAAAASGHIRVVKLLLLSAELWQVGVRNALERAVENDHVSIVKVLVGFCTASEIKAAAARVPVGGRVKISRLLREKEFEKRKEEARVRNEVETLETIDCICNLCDCVMPLLASICGLLQEP